MAKIYNLIDDQDDILSIAPRPRRRSSTALAAHDVITGGTQNDKLYGETGDDYLYGDQPVPTVFDTGDTLQGGDDADHLYGGAFPDTLRGGTGGNDNDFVDGGPSMNDTCREYEQAPANCP